MVATEWRVWLASKLFAGIGNGFAQTALVIYNSEIAPPQIRGFLLSTWAFFYALGQLTASIGLQILATVSRGSSVVPVPFFVPVSLCPTNPCVPASGIIIVKE